MPTLKQTSKSKTMQFAALLAVLSTIAGSMEALAPYFGAYGGLAGVVVAAAIAGLRAVTKESLSDK